MRRSSRKKKKSLLYWLLVRIPFWWIACSLTLVLLLKWAPVLYTPLMLKRSVEYRADADFHTRKKWVPLERISPEMVKAVITTEDTRFGDHRGIDWTELRLMWKAHQDRGKEIRGCSTISQQTAKNVFTTGSSTVLRKVAEVYWVWLIEWIWGKERIMEVYLNVAEMGKGIYGAEAAARAYYEIPAEKLNRSQAVSIAICLPNPITRSPLKPTAYSRKRQAQVMSLIPKVKYPDWVGEGKK